MICYLMSWLMLSHHGGSHDMNCVHVTHAIRPRRDTWNDLMLFVLTLVWWLMSLHHGGSHDMTCYIMPWHPSFHQGESRDMTCYSMSWLMTSHQGQSHDLLASVPTHSLCCGDTSHGLWPHVTSKAILRHWSITRPAATYYVPLHLVTMDGSRYLWYEFLLWTTHH